MSKSNAQEPSDKECRIAAIKRRVDEAIEKYRDEYALLADRSEKLDDEEIDLKKAYARLDGKSLLNTLFEQLGELEDDESQVKLNPLELDRKFR